MSAAIITVHNSSELASAVEALASGIGGTILLDGSGSPYVLDLSHNRNRTDAPVRLTSTDPDHPAVIAKLRTIERENITIDNVVFDSSSLVRNSHHRDVEFTGSTGMTIADSAFHGGATQALDGTAGQVKGATMALVRSSEDIALTGNTVEGYYHGIAFKDSRDLTFTNNEMTKLQGDAIRIAGAQDLLIQGNFLHDMLGTTQDINHSDMIQFWGTNIAQNTERVTIRDNVIASGIGPAYQMIFGRNEHKGHNGWLFEDILIEGNVLHGAHHNMISIADTQGLAIRHNTVLWNPETQALLREGEHARSINGWVRAPGGNDPLIENNLATNILTSNGANGVVGYGLGGDGEHHFDHFINLDANATADLRDLSLVPGSIWDGRMGAPMTWSSNAVDTVQAIARAHRSPTDRSVVTLNAGLSREADGRLSEEGTEYIWSFENGVRKRGAIVTHDFGTSGVHRYTLEVRTEDGHTDRIERTLRIADPELLKLSFDGDSIHDVSSYATRVTLKGAAPEVHGFVLDGTSRIEVDREANQLYSLNQFALNMTFAPDERTSGTLFELFQAMEGRLTKDGALVLDITTTKGRHQVSTAAGAVSGTEPQELRFVLDSGELQILVDGKLFGSAPVDGITKPVESWGLVIGNVFGGSSARGVVSEVSMHAEPRMIDGGPDSEFNPLEGAAMLAHLTFDKGVRDSSGQDINVEWDEDAVLFTMGSSGLGRAVKLGGRGDNVTLSRSNADLFDREMFHIAFDLQRDEGGKGGRVLTLHKTLDLFLEKDGRLAFTLATDEGKATARTTAAVVTGTDWHHVELAYDGKAGVMQLVVEDAVVAEAELMGSTAAARYWGLTLGRPWGGEADGAIDEFKFYDAAYIRSADAETPLSSATQSGWFAPIAVVPETDASDTPAELVEEVGSLTALETSMLYLDVCLA